MSSFKAIALRDFKAKIWLIPSSQWFLLRQLPNLLFFLDYSILSTHITNDYVTTIISLYYLYQCFSMEKLIYYHPKMPFKWIVYVVIFLSGYLIELFSSIYISHGIYLGHFKIIHVILPKILESVSYLYLKNWCKNYSVQF